MAINTRSPYYVNTSITDTSYTTLDVYIWEGSVTATTTPKYSLKKYAIIGSNWVGYEIAELIRDYIEVIFDGDYNGQSVWYKSIIKVYNSSDVLLNTIDYTTQSAFDSYSYFEENESFNLDYKSLLMSNREMFVLADNVFRIPVNTINSPTVLFLKNGEVVSTQILSSSTESSNQIKYISVDGGAGNYDSFKSRVLEDNGTFENTKCLKDFLNEFEIGEVDTVRISDINGLQTIKIKTLDECKYEPKKVTFINKFGVLQDMFFFKKAVEKMTVKKESYKANIRNQYDSYSISSHVNREFNVIGNESISLSSGYLSEEYNEVFKQLLLSEKVWITNVTDTAVQVLPLNVITSSITYKTSLNDRLVEYTIEFNNSYDTINNIR